MYIVQLRQLGKSFTMRCMCGQFDRIERVVFRKKKQQQQPCLHHVLQFTHHTIEYMNMV